MTDRTTDPRTPAARPTDPATGPTSDGPPTPVRKPAPDRSPAAAPLGVAVVGAGVIGELHCRAVGLADGLALRAVVDVAEDRARGMGAAFGVPWATSVPAALAEVPGIDVVAICTPSGLHADLAVQALELGRHVMIEKPIDVTDASAERIAAAQAASGTIAAVISQHRFDPATEEVREAVDAGALGRLTSGVATVPWWRGQEYYDSGAWRGTWALDGGGSLMNQSVHAIDLLISFLGTPTEVFGYTATLSHERIEVEDTAVGCVRFDSGALGVIHGTTAAWPGLSVRVQVHGDRGSAIIEGDELVTLRRDRAPRAVVTPADGVDARPGASAAQDDGHAHPAASETGSPGPDGAVTTAPTDAAEPEPTHVRQYEDLARAIRTGSSVRVGIPEARTALAVITGLYASARTHAPVSLPRFSR